MSSPISTPAALSSEARPYTGHGWRLVEAQHRVSTLKLVDSLAEQDLLEDLLEASKPAVPPECRHLHYLLATPFRYGAPYPHGSRFRRAGLTPGVFYAAEEIRTAIAELSFYRLLFFAESPGTPWPRNALEFTGIRVALAAAASLDLTKPPLSDGSNTWRDPVDYTACQDLAEVARTAAIGLIRYASVRDPNDGRNLAVLTCRAFARPEPLEARTIHVQLGPFGARALCDFPRLACEFALSTWRADPRVRALLERS